MTTLADIEMVEAKAHGIMSVAVSDLYALLGEVTEAWQQEHVAHAADPLLLEVVRAVADRGPWPSYMGDRWCFYCHAQDYGSIENHSSGCTWVRAVKLSGWSKDYR